MLSVGHNFSSMRARAVEIVRRLKAAGHKAYFVGGCVRDELLGKEPQDYDIATSARPEQIESLFPHTIPVGRKFGVVLVIEQGKQFQAATFRAEADYRDGRHPGRITFCDAMADARRRDFTVNGLFFDPIEDRLHDWVGGELDLRSRIIRTIGNPYQRFAEDHLRLLRAVRFAAQLNFRIEAKTFAGLRAAQRDNIVARWDAPGARRTRPADCIWCGKAACCPKSCRRSRPRLNASSRRSFTPKARSLTI